MGNWTGERYIRKAYWRWILNKLLYILCFGLGAVLANMVVSQALISGQVVEVRRLLGGTPFWNVELELADGEEGEGGPWSEILWVFEF